MCFCHIAHILLCPGMGMVQLLLSCFTVGFIPAAVIWAGIYVCRGLDPNRKALIKTIKAVNAHLVQAKLLVKAKNINKRELRRRYHRRSRLESMQAPQPQRESVAQHNRWRPHVMLYSVASAATSLMDLVRPAVQDSQATYQSSL
ncbi:hypothetical protein ElyMa_001274800 [Elysia marginata]|uniref:Uncharacterized protein n=1 Tax=Elysia marginata TaxID=1093978 RepID=A0AAV4IEX8_9GAST|nr:hypothetical protein ElyMa_001274800 [Elysia marginata]